MEKVSRVGERCSANAASLRHLAGAAIVPFFLLGCGDQLEPAAMAPNAATETPPCSVERDAPDLAGAGAIDCGTGVFTGDPAASQRARACILDAIAHERPFFASVVGPSFDSHYVEGFVGRRSHDHYETLHLGSDTLGGVPEPPRWDAATCHPLEDLVAKCGRNRAWENRPELYRACSAFVDHVRGGPDRAVTERYGLDCSTPTPTEICSRGARTRSASAVER